MKILERNEIFKSSGLTYAVLKFFKKVDWVELKNINPRTGPIIICLVWI